MALRARRSIVSALVIGLVALGLSLVFGYLLTRDTSLICLELNDTDVPTCWHPQNLTVIAALWVLGTVLGILDTFRTFGETNEERQQARDDPVLATIAGGNVRRELFRMLELFALLIVGSIAITGTVATVFSRLLVLFVVIMIVTNAHLDRRERRTTDDLIKAARANGGNKE